MHRLLLSLAVLVFFNPVSYAQELQSPAQQQAPERFLGLLELPPLCYWGCPNAEDPLPLYATPDQGEAPVLVLTAEMLWLDPKHQDRDSRFWPVTEEFTYERSGAVVYEQRGDWYRIRINERDLWVSETHAGPFHPYPQLLDDQLAYLPDWNFILWEAPGEAPSPVLHPLMDNPELNDRIPARILDFEQKDGRWWVHVEIQEAFPCVAEMENFFAAGWVPAYTESGRRSVWFFSRGC